MAKIYAYARCSLGEEYGQDLRRQARELEAAGAEEIITEREHGDKEKAVLNDLLERMEPQLTLMVCEVSRLARSTKMLCEIINVIKEKHLRLVILGEYSATFSVLLKLHSSVLSCSSFIVCQILYPPTAPVLPQKTGACFPAYAPILRDVHKIFRACSIKLLIQSLSYRTSGLQDWQRDF